MRVNGILSEVADGKKNRWRQSDARDRIGREALRSHGGLREIVPRLVARRQ